MAVRTVAALAALAAACVGCSDPKKASEANFAKAIGQYLAQRGQVCIRSLTRSWPADVDANAKPVRNSFGSESEAMRLDALAQAGLLRTEMTEVEQRSFYGRPAPPRPVRRYHLAEAAKPFVRTSPSGAIHGPEHHHDICWARRALHKVVQWEGPMAFGEYQVARVTYTYRLEDVAPWVEHPAVKASFPEIATEQTPSRDRTEHRKVNLTSNGWQAEGLNERFFH